MKPEVERALRRAAEARRVILSGLSREDRQNLLEQLFVDSFFDQWLTLAKWAALTGQSAQGDTGYIAQHAASILLAEPGQGFRGKGTDLMDRTEVKSAAIVAGVDRPRWNHNLGSIAGDEKRRKDGKSTLWEEFLTAPAVFYLLFDVVVDENEAEEQERILRVRAWCLDARADSAWRDLILKWVEQRKSSTYNFQLHPPVGYDDSIVVNTLGNLDMEDVKVLEARIHATLPEQKPSITWIKPPPDNVRPIVGRCKAVPYGGRGARPSRLNSASDVLPDLAIIQRLLPEVDIQPAMDALSEELEVEVDELRDDDNQVE